VVPALQLAVLVIFSVALVLIQTPHFTFYEPLLQVESNFSTLHIKGFTLLMAFVTLSFISFHPKEKLAADFEFIPLFLIAVLATFLFTASTDLLNVYLTLELQAFSFYILTTYNKKSIFSTEAGVKYFVLGAFSSCLILYALAQIYLMCGTLNLTNLRHYRSCIITCTQNT
jgi:NADH-quinone oxidoreductase subunit N